MRSVRFAALVLVACAAGGCPPPLDRAPTDAEGRGGRDAPPTQPLGGAPSGETPVGAAEVPDAPTTPSSVVYENLDGGRPLARCPACGEVLATGAATCAGCGAVTTWWKRELPCAACRGNGACAHCGDDRACLDCAGDGRCAECAGRGRVDGAPCDACGGKARCASCGGDGWRESVHADFLPGQTALPGLCGTCRDGGGLCPDCCGSGHDVDGGTCLTCGGGSVCPECAGSGLCVHDAGYGYCVVCRGGGVEVVGAPPRAPGSRQFQVRRKDGTLQAGRVLSAPSPNVVVRITARGRTHDEALLPAQVQPLSYYVVWRDHSALDTAQDVEALAEVALQGSLPALAARDLARAAALDPARARALSGPLARAEGERVGAWLDAAGRALDAGDREGAALLLAAARARARLPDAVAAVARLDERVAEATRTELAALDDAARARADAALAERVARTVARARRRLERAAAFLRDAEQAGGADAAAWRGFERADFAAAAAERLVGADAHRAPPPRVAWPTPPAELLASARALRGRVALAHAIAQAAGRRFDVAVRLARRAVALAPGDTHAADVLRELERALVRAAVDRGTPPPSEDR